MRPRLQLNLLDDQEILLGYPKNKILEMGWKIHVRPVYYKCDIFISNLLWTLTFACADIAN